VNIENEKIQFVYLAQEAKLSSKVTLQSKAWVC
jgi:hypothetical protein